jgi:protein TonB
VVNTRNISTETILNTTTGPVVTAVTQSSPTPNSASPAPVVTQDPLIAEPAPEPVTTPAPAPPVNAEIVKALKFLGQQSLDAYKLTYPPGDNAYYYFSRLLEIEPGNPEAVNGILQIADRYAFLAEQAVLNNENEKASAYADIGLRINPRNEALLALKNFSQAQDGSLWTTVRKLFSGK